MVKLFQTLFLHNRLFYLLGLITVLFVVGFFIPVLFEIGKVVLFTLALLVLVDFLLLYTTKNAITLERDLPEKLSNGDENKIKLSISNTYPFKVHCSIIEELPYQFQKRDFIFKQSLKSKEDKTLFYNVKPSYRGEYFFGHTNIYVSSPLQLVTRKYIQATEKQINCYPSFLRMREFDIANVSSHHSIGTKKVRRIGHSMEFEQIKEYVAGDDIRSLNWKATAKKNQLMVNQFIEERSQPIYCILDKGRAMQLSFEKLTLLDYAINATLAVSNVVLRKHDKAGMFSFSHKLEDIIMAEQRNSQMNMISETLYNLKTDFTDSDFSLLYAVVKRKITHRSLLLLFTNFETMDALHRQLPYLRAIAKNHLLVVVFFKNTELDELLEQKVTDIQGVYDKIIAEKFMFEKRQIVNELKKYGIQSILTEPQNLTSNTINTYLSFKSRGLI